MDEKFSNFFEASLNSAKKLSQLIAGIFSGFRNKNITVETEVKGSEKVKGIKRDVESLPKAKSLEVKVEKHGDFSGLSLTGKDLGKTISVNSEVTGLDQVQELGMAINKLPEKKTIAVPPVSQWAKLKDEFVGLRSNVNDLGGGMKNLTGKLMASGGALMIIYQGFKSLIKIGQHFYNSWIDGMKEAAAMSEQNASSIREAAQANEELRQKGDEYLKQLEQLASQENLSNANKEQAVKAIGELTKAYGDLGIKLDETTGKLTGVDSAMIKKAEKDKARRIKELEAELRELENSNQQQAELRDKAGIPVWFGGNVRLGGKETSEAAAKKIEENNQRIMVIRRNLHDLRQSDPAGEIRARKKAEEEQLEVKNRERQKAFEQRQKDDEFAAAKTPEAKIANRQDLIRKFTQETLDPLNRQVAAAQQNWERAKGEDDKREARRNLLQLQSQQLAAKEKVYHWEKQIRDVEQRSGIKAQPAASVRAEKPADIPAPKPSEPDGKTVNVTPKTNGQSADPAASSKKSAPAQAVTPPVQPDKTPAEQKLPDRKNSNQPQIKSTMLQKSSEKKESNQPQINTPEKQSLQISNRDKAQDLKWQFMEKIGQGREASEQRALRDAERTKGGKLTDSEIDATKKLHELAWNMSNMRDQQFGDLSIKTNSLTARGGFQGAAVVPDSDKYNREISMTNKTMLGVLQRIERLCDKFGKF